MGAGSKPREPEYPERMFGSNPAQPVESTVGREGAGGLLFLWGPADVLRLFVQEVFRSLLRRARDDRGALKARCGEVTFVQRFSGTLNLNFTSTHWCSMACRQQTGERASASIDCRRRTMTRWLE